MENEIALKICDRSIRFSSAYQNGLTLLRSCCQEEYGQLIDETSRDMKELHLRQTPIRERMTPETDWSALSATLGPDAAPSAQAAVLQDVERIYHREIADLHRSRLDIHKRLEVALSGKVPRILAAMGARLALHETHLLNKHRQLRAKLANTWVDQYPLIEVLPLLQGWAETDPMDAALQNLLCRVTALVDDSRAGANRMVDVVRQYPSLGLYRTPGFKPLQEQAITRGIPSIFLNTQFKSGSGFLLHTLCQGLSAPYTYITTWGYGNHTLVPDWIADFARGGALSQDHLPADPAVLAPLLGSGLQRIHVHVRDPRQSMLSAIHYFEKNISEMDTEARLMFRHGVPNSFLEKDLSGRIDYYIDHEIFERDFTHDAHWVLQWLRAHRERSLGIDILLTDFRELVGRNRQFIEKILAFFELERHFDWSAVDDFIAKPKAGSPAHLHFRKGEIDEWRSVLTPAQAQRVNTIMGRDLVDYFDSPAPPT